jgi:peptidoglycan hydrolase-like protein with peptidoglycan-binding domain
MKKLILFFIPFIGIELVYAQSIITGVAVTVSPADATSTQIMVSSTENFNFKRNLSFGMRGEDVRSLQIYLNMHGYTVAAVGNGSLGHESDYFGMKTQSALKKFQAAYGIPPTGLMGALSIAKIQNLEGR